MAVSPKLGGPVRRDFEISLVGSSSDRSRKRTQHLRTVHGFLKIPRLLGKGLLSGRFKPLNLWSSGDGSTGLQSSGNELGAHMTLKLSLVASLSIRANLEKFCNMQDTAVSGAAALSQLETCQFLFAQAIQAEAKLLAFSAEIDFGRNVFKWQHDFPKSLMALVQRIAVIELSMGEKRSTQVL